MVNPTLSVGEFGIETDTNKVKIGDGSTQWSLLGYLQVNLDGGNSGPSVPAAMLFSNDAHTLSYYTDDSLTQNYKTGD